MVSTALFTALSGLRAHQDYIDVIGNNLANVSTPGFRGSRATFSDILSFTVQSGSGPNGNFGGTNPLQIGHGAVMSSVDTNTTQGTFADTGRPLDCAIEGRGFFTLTDGSQQFFTRAGTFGIDANRNLVDSRTGYRVLSSSGTDIKVPVSDTLPARATTSIKFQGDLPAQVGGPLAEIIQGDSALKAGTAATKVATGTAGTGTQFDLSTPPGRTVLVSVNGGAQTSVDFPAATFGAGPVNASVVAARFNQTFTANNLNSLVAVGDDVAGTVTFQTVKLGDSATLKFDDGSGSTGTLALMGLTSTLVNGGESTATGATDIGLLTARQQIYAPGDHIVISGTNPNGTAFSDTFVYGAANNGTDLNSLISFINQTLDNTQATASLTSDGNIRVTANNTGTAQLTLTIGEPSGNVGRTTWPQVSQLQAGTGPDTAETSIDVIDSQGRSHAVTMTFTRSSADPTVWDMTATMAASEGTVSQASVSQIRFNANGSFSVIGGGNNNLSFAFNGIPGTQNIAVNLGTTGNFDGVAMLGNSTTIAATDQDGWGPGTLVSVAFDRKGNLSGYYTNGQSQVLSQLRLSVFPNEEGLSKVGNTMWVESPNSDNAIATTAGSAGAGDVRPGALENSNVDIASEFVNLIEAQRGFQANSRVITTTDQILADLINIVH
jgi:flagellar hook protein FlgE